MIIARTADAPAFADESIDYTAKFLTLIKSSPDYLKWFDEPDKIIGFVKEFSSSRNSEGMLHFVGRVDENEIAYVGVSGMNVPTPEIQISGAGCDLLQIYYFRGTFHRLLTSYIVTGETADRR